MSEPRVMTNERRKSIREMGAQLHRIYRGLGGYEGVRGENRARYAVAERAYQNYENNIMSSNAVPADYNYDAANYPVPRSVYMRNNRR